MEKLYERINFENIPSKKTPLSAENLNKIDSAINAIDNRVIETHDELKSDLGNLNDIMGNYLNGVEWEIGGVSSTGENSSSSKRLRMKTPLKLVKGSSLSIVEGWNFFLYFYDENGVFINHSTVWFTDYTFTEDSNVRVVISYVTPDTITDLTLANNLSISVGSERVYDCIRELYGMNSSTNIVYDETTLLSAIQSDSPTVILTNDINVTETITINRDIHLIGNGYTIRGTHDSTFTNLIVFNADTVSIVDDVVFSHAYDSVVAIYGNVTLNRCDVSNSKRNDGIGIYSHATVVLNECKSHDNYDEGVSSHGGSYCEVNGGEFYNNGYIIGSKTKGAESSFGGVHLGGGRMGIVRNVYSHDNCTYGIALINFQDLESTDIEKCYGNLVENNGGDGIFLTACRDLSLSNNTVIKNTGKAIHFGLDTTYTPKVDLIASSGYVSGNIMVGNGENAVVVDSNAQSDKLYIN